MLDLESTRVGQFLSETLVVDENLPISKLIGKLSSLKRYEAFIPISGEIQIIGLRDLLNAFNIVSQKASSLSWPIPFLNPDSSLTEAVGLMMKFRVKALPVLDDGTLSGEVTASTILQEAQKKGFFNFPISRIMTTKIITIQAGDPLSKARNLMVDNQIDHLPILQGTILEGVLTSGELIPLIEPKTSPRMG